MISLFAGPRTAAACIVPRTRLGRSYHTRVGLSPPVGGGTTTMVNLHSSVHVVLYYLQAVFPGRKQFFPGG
jgi:hypothetical protein